MPWAAAGAIGGALITANAAGNAADQQSGASQQATMAQMMAQAQLRDDLSPWTKSGAAAQSTLDRYLGLGGAGSSGVTSLGLATGLTPDQVRQQLLSRFTTTSATSGASLPPGVTQEQWNAIYGAGGVDPASQRQVYRPRDVGSNTVWEWVPDGPAQTPTSTVDEAGLNAAIKQYYDEQDALNAQAAQDPTYGSLLRAFHNGAEFDSGPAFSFTGDDLATEPGYKFGLDQGTQGINRAQAARGNFLSGGAMKELSRYTQDYAGTKFNDAFNRAQSSYNTNLTRRQNEWNTNLNAYNQNRNTIYDFLTGVSRTGQNSAAQVGTSNNRAAETIGNNITNAGTAQSAATVAGGNALTSAINTGVNNSNLNGAGGWNNLLSSFNIGRSGNNYNGSSSNVSAPNYVNSLDNFWTQ